jgi:hypothetical protein
MKLTYFAAVILMASAARGQIIAPLLPNGSSASTALYARARPDAVQLQGFEYVIPSVIIGGEWTSTIRFTNRGTTPVPTTNVFLIDNAGNPMQATFQTTNGTVVTAASFTVNMPVGTMVEATFLGTENSQFGHAIIDCSSPSCSSPGMYGEVALRNRNSTRPDFEAVFPFERPSSVQYMLFDGRNGLTTLLYLVNEMTFSNQITLDIVDINNRIIRTVPIPSSILSSQILMLHALAPETIGIQGTLVIRAQSSSSLVTAVGLRINPSNSFTPLRAFVR